MASFGGVIRDTCSAIAQSYKLGFPNPTLYIDDESKHYNMRCKYLPVWERGF